MKRITAKMLRDAGACESQVKIFEAEWPKGATVTMANCKRVVELGLNMHWAACNLLSGQALAAYNAAMAEAWVALSAATAGAAMDEEGVNYDAAMAELWAAYQTAVAQAFCAAFNEEQ